MTTDGPKYKRPTVDGYYGLTNLSRIGVGYYVANYLKLERFSQNGVGMIQNLLFMVGSSRGQDSRFSSLPHGFESRTDYTERGFGVLPLSIDK